MNQKLPSFYHFSEEVARALSMQLPVVALESTVITHGLPYPQNKQLAQDMENEVRSHSAVPATVAVVAGQVHIGVQFEDLERLARGEDVHKISSRDFAGAIAKKWDGGTTVAGTMLAAQAAGIQVFATGGIGGVHRRIGEDPVSAALDISADLPQLARTPMIVVCAGAKAILDLEATLEYLETSGVPVLGYQTDDFPAFYSRSSGLKASVRADSPEEVVEIARAHWQMGMQSAVLVTVPLPKGVALIREYVDGAIEQALQEAASQNVRGQAVTPFLLQRITEITSGASLQANLGLLRNNARVASEIARHLVKGRRTRFV